MDTVVECEKSVIGGCFLESFAAQEACSRLKPDDFSDKRHRVIFQSISYLVDSGQPVDLVSVTTELRSSRGLEMAGGTAYLGELVDFVPTAANINYYLHKVEESATQRQVYAAGDEIRLMVSKNLSSDVLIDRAESKIFSIRRDVTNGPIPIRESLPGVHKKISWAAEHPGEISGLSTGYRKLDWMMGGLRPSNLIIVAGRPAVGKSALGLNIIENISINTKSPVASLIFSLEMGSEDLTTRLACSLARVDHTRARVGKLSGNELTAFTAAMEQLHSAPIFIDDTSTLSIGELRSTARRMKRKENIGLIVVDYLQLVRGGKQKGGNREQEVAEVSRGLKALANELGLPIIALAQLNRAVEYRTEKRPTTADLRESGSIEQDADTILLLYRDAIYCPDCQKHSGRCDKGHETTAELSISKQRNGSTGVIKLHWSGKFTRFDQEENHA